MRQLDNVACSNGYTAAATIDDYYPGGRAVYLVANNSVYMRVKRPTQQGQGGSEWSNEFLVNPSTGAFRGLVGIQFRNAVAGSVARVVCQLWLPSDAQPEGSNAFTGTLSASGGVTPGSVNPAGTVLAFAGASAPSGYVLCDGSTYDGTTSTYSALWAAIGGTYGGVQAAFQVPDLRGRVVAGKGTHVDVDALGDNDGVAVANRRPAHNHTFTNPTISTPSITVTDPGHFHAQKTNTAIGDAGADWNTGATGTGYAFGGNTGSKVTGITAALSGAPTASGGAAGPGGTAAVDEPAYLVLNYIISLG